MANVHLVEPYRSALVSRAFDEELIAVTHHDIEEKSVTLRSGANSSNQRAVMQTLILFDNVTVLW